MAGDPELRPDSRATHNTASGHVGGHVVQAGSIGEVHIIGAPQQLPPDAVPIAVSTEVIGDTTYARLLAPPDPTDFLVPISGHAVRVFVEALDRRTVILRALRPVIVELAAPPARQLWPHAGIITPRAFEVVLDDPSPRLRRVGATPDFPFSVSAADPEVFDVTVHTRAHDVRWRLELDWTCAGRGGTTPVDLAGHPFRTVPAPEK
jgi:hypothetical protein